METNRSHCIEREYIQYHCQPGRKYLQCKSRQKITVKTQIPEGTKAIDRPSQEEALNLIYPHTFVMTGKLQLPWSHFSRGILVNSKRLPMPRSCQVIGKKHFSKMVGM